MQHLPSRCSSLENSWTRSPRLLALPPPTPRRSARFSSTLLSLLSFAFFCCSTNWDSNSSTCHMSSAVSLGARTSRPSCVWHCTSGHTECLRSSSTCLVVQPPRRFASLVPRQPSKRHFCYLAFRFVDEGFTGQGLERKDRRSKPYRLHPSWF